MDGRYLSRGSTRIVLFILFAVVLDVFSTTIGVLRLGNGEASPMARAVIQLFGNNWWIVYLPYEATVLVLCFFVIRIVRLRAQSRVPSRIVGIPVENLVPFAIFVTILNNAYQILVHF